MNAFSAALKQLRRLHGLRQVDLVEALGGDFSRSTIANVECGRELPSPRFWEALQAVYPDETALMAEDYLAARARVGTGSGRGRPGSRTGPAPIEEELRLGGPFVIERLDLVYVFRESRSPEEVLEVRSLRATRNGADSYVLKVVADNEGFRTAPEILWGGSITEESARDVAGKTLLIRRVAFEPALRRGMRHVFALRSWVDRDPFPDVAIECKFTLPADTLGIHAAFLGSKPTSVWRFGPLHDEATRPDSARHADAKALPLVNNGNYSATFDHPAIGLVLGIGWSWD